MDNPMWWRGPGRLRIVIDTKCGHYSFYYQISTRTIFFKSLNVNSKGETFSAESLFMALILQQQKMIIHLIDKLSKYDTNMQYWKNENMYTYY
jgi:hypothetical protein